VQTDSTPDPLFLAWLAGFVDGEGCITVLRGRTPKGNPRYDPYLTIANTDRPVLDAIAATLGHGGVYATTRRGLPHWRQGWAYMTHGARALALVGLLRPHLRVKGAQADLLLTFRALPMGMPGPRKTQAERWRLARAEQEAVYLGLRTLKGNTTKGRPRRRD